MIYQETRSISQPKNIYAIGQYINLGYLGRAVNKIIGRIGQRSKYKNLIKEIFIVSICNEYVKKRKFHHQFGYFHRHL
jgi:hypothetical protein